MSTNASENNSTGGEGAAANDVRRAFAELPFEQKVSTLVRIELDMLGDAVETVVSAASTAFDDIAAACSNCASDRTPAPEDQPSPSGI